MNLLTYPEKVDDSFGDGQPLPSFRRFWLVQVELGGNARFLWHSFTLGKLKIAHRTSLKTQNKSGPIVGVVISTIIREKEPANPLGLWPSFTLRKITNRASKMPHTTPNNRRRPSLNYLIDNFQRQRPQILWPSFTFRKSRIAYRSAKVSHDTEQSTTIRGIALSTIIRELEPANQITLWPSFTLRKSQIEHRTPLTT